MQSPTEHQASHRQLQVASALPVLSTGAVSLICDTTLLSKIIHVSALLLTVNTRPNQSNQLGLIAGMAALVPLPFLQQWVSFQHPVMPKGLVAVPLGAWLLQVAEGLLWGGFTGSSRGQGLTTGLVAEGWAGGKVWQPGWTSAAAGFKLGYSHCRSLNIIFIFQSHFFWHLSPLWTWLSSRRGGRRQKRTLLAFSLLLWPSWKSFSVVPCSARAKLSCHPHNPGCCACCLDAFSVPPAEGSQWDLGHDLSHLGYTVATMESPCLLLHLPVKLCWEIKSCWWQKVLEEVLLSMDWVLS